MAARGDPTMLPPEQCGDAQLSQPTLGSRLWERCTARLDTVGRQLHVHAAAEAAQAAEAWMHQRAAAWMHSVQGSLPVHQVSCRRVSALRVRVQWHWPEAHSAAGQSGLQLSPLDLVLRD